MNICELVQFSLALFGLIAQYAQPYLSRPVALVTVTVSRTSLFIDNRLVLYQ